MPLTLTYTDSHATVQQLKIKELTNLEKVQKFKHHHERVVERTNMLTGLPNKRSYVRTFHGVRCDIVADPNDEHAELKIKQLKEALGQISGHERFMPPGNKIKVYCASSYSNPQSSYSNASVGFVYIDPNKAVNRLQVALILGDSVYATDSRLLADDVYDYYRRTWTVNAHKKRALSAIFHELGHVYHQIYAASHYFALSALVMVINARADFAQHRNYVAFPARPTQPQLNQFKARILEYGGQVSSYAERHPNEFVAEVFSGLMMGVPFAANITAAYQALGGQQPAQGMAHVRTGRR